MAKMPANIKSHMQNKPAPRKTGGRVPTALSKWHKAHPDAKNAHKGK